MQNKPKLTKERKTSIENHLKEISQMGRLELGAFDMILQENKQDMDAVVWKWVNKGVIGQMAHLMDIDLETGGALAVMSELRMGEV